MSMFASILMTSDDSCLYSCVNNLFHIFNRYNAMGHKSSVLFT